MGWIWFIVAVLLFGFLVYKLGGWDTNDDKVGLVGVIFFGALLWPFILAVAIVVGPFVGLYLLGERQRKKKQEKSGK
ncbi:hypothetical protein UFOVP447_129 [uncultured Caudovirales phage]|uniref:Uncharacterized protein n=1 Tax=uncultured Caudovirales phage TaxID=2100421 RepID=A0A6J5MAX0_9CAUD|nr:hypothetical protein UFOVP447_129 [uncultured Caudovirales phage]